MTLLWPLLLTGLGVVLAMPSAGRLGRDASWLVAGAYLAAAVALLPAARAAADGEPLRASWAWVPAWGVSFALRADGLGLVFAFLALLIGAVVLVYATRYLGPGPQLSFTLLMAVFTASMVLLVLADDLVLLFVAWELTSVASFLLIARSGTAGEGASMRTLLVTVTGGLALLVAIGLIAHRLGTTSLPAVLADPVWRTDPAFAGTVAVLVALAGMSKSAQLPFHVWLPDAMAAITPVSAYLHAAAVVKAGIFLLLRFSPAFHAVPAWNVLLLVAGLATGLLGGWFALQQTDLKRLMAYSTVSQLGLIVAVVAIGTPLALTAALVHTVAHALFKSGLFMVVGVVDHATHTRDLRRLPPLARAMPATFAVTLLGCASMAGLPPMLGFVSKEALLTGLLSRPGPAWTGPAALAGAALASILTVAYCAKIVLGGFVDGTDDRPVEKVDTRLVVCAALPILVGLPLGLAPGVLDHPVQRALDAVLPGHGHQVHLALWHGIGTELLVTAAVVTAGALLAARRRRRRAVPARPTFSFDGPGVLTALDRAVQRLGRAVSAPTAPPEPARHLAPLVGVLGVVLTAGSLIARRDGLPAVRPGSSRPVDALLLVLVAAAVALLVRARSRVGATVALSAVGILVTVQILALGAPDVALTQLLVESLTVIVVMLVLQKLPRTFPRPAPRRRAGAVALALLGGTGAGLATHVLNGRRDPGPVGDYYTRSATEVTGGDNIVNVILVEFRALDTLGELTVLGMAGVAILAVLSTVRDRHLDPADRPADDTAPALRAEGSTAHRAITTSWANVLPLQLVLRVVVPVLLVLSATIFWRGHDAPGGGFIAALVASSVVGLVYLSTSVDRQIGPPRLPLRLIGGGILTAVATGLGGLALGGSFLQPLPTDLGPLHLTSSMLFDVGVFAAVVGMVMLAFNLLGTSRASTDHPGGEGTRERADEAVEGELPGSLDTVRGEPARVGRSTTFLADGRRPGEAGR